MLDNFDRIYSQVSLHDWFTCLIAGIVSVNMSNLSVPILSLVTSIIDFDPIVHENSTRSITAIMLKKKESDEIKVKSRTLLKVFFF